MASNKNLRPTEDKNQQIKIAARQQKQVSVNHRSDEGLRANTRERRNKHNNKRHNDLI